MPWTVLPPNTLSNMTDDALDDMLHGDAPIPRFFLTGDGHGNPPFQWVNACPAMTLYFQNLMFNNRLCAHVEQHQEDVTINSVPNQLQLLYGQNRIFGWELDIYRDLQPLMEMCLAIAAAPNLNPGIIANDVVELHREIVRVDALLWQIGNPAGLRNLVGQSFQFRGYFQGVASNGNPRNLATEGQYAAFVMNYFNIAMGLRTTVNNYIGQNIQNVINAHPNDTHIITCGDAHIFHNPLQNYINLPHGANGVVDSL